MFIPLAQRLRDATRSLHTEVERSPFMRTLLRGEMRREPYTHLLRNLHEVYAGLEAGLAAHPGHPGLAALPLADLVRGPALQADLRVLHGEGWSRELPLTSGAIDYARHLRALAHEQPAALAAHAYVRYLGDLSGGQMLLRIVGKGLQRDGSDGLGFYDFGPPEQVAALARRFRSGLDCVASDEAEAAMLVQEACDGFARHKLLFEQLAPLAA